MTIPLVVAIRWMDGRSLSRLQHVAVLGRKVLERLVGTELTGAI